jgi:Flp pilus assembly protein TadG
MTKPGKQRRGGSKSWLSDRRGITAVEFALVAPWLFFLMLGILELGTAMFSQSLLDGAARDAARQIMTGLVQIPAGSGNTTAKAAAAAFKAQLCSETGDSAGVGLVSKSFLDCEKFTYDVQSYATISALNTAVNPAPPAVPVAPANQFAPGNPGDYVAVQVIYNRPALLPASATHLLGTETLTTTVIFRNEPYPQQPPGP